MHSSGVDRQRVLAFIEAVDRTHTRDTVGVLALHTGISDDVGHGGNLATKLGRTPEAMDAKIARVQNAAA